MRLHRTKREQELYDILGKADKEGWYEYVTCYVTNDGRVLLEEPIGEEVWFRVDKHPRLKKNAPKWAKDAKKELDDLTRDMPI